MSKDDACRNLDKLVNKLQGLKRKVEEAMKEEEALIQRSKSRLDHLATIAEADLKDVTGDVQRRYYTVRLYRCIVDYLLRNGYYKTAIELAKDTNITELVDIEIFLNSKKVVESLQNHDCKEALKWCNDNRSKLKKINSTLEFELHLQECIELIREQKFMDAIQYARKNLAPQVVQLQPVSQPASTNLKESQTKLSQSTGSLKTSQNSLSQSGSRLSSSQNTLKESQNAENEESAGNAELYSIYMSKLQQVMVTLALSKESVVEKYQSLFGDERWAELVWQFEKDNYAVHGLPPCSHFEINLQAGIAALKTTFCYEDENTNINCPICTPAMRNVAMQIPNAIHGLSTLICRISGEIMSDDNPPMVLPNGYAYSRNSLWALAQQNGGLVTCPRTKQTFKFEELKRAFIS
eukprot:CAMPEP_0168546516 /NCGR_PEP_ID=MMETSP0413-20121227/3541_1 /TAXON_ID=136452 /ORGANISM="Filamoeba nolandi, Strain NC-AS-23-1" /LENGTH=407 /DNA_ID=CAMNT_0008576701 /DNA_START=101 /DNA_END=1324 /DNA_ORIENTATION=-